jgi:hypothetical protein
MSITAKNYKLSPMLGLMLITLACIPREKPPEKRLVLEQVGVLPQVLRENSGMTESGGLIWFINDSGNEPALYGYDREQDSIVRTVVVRNSTNNDWEEISQNGEHFYIGDFGNNESGNRNDLRIYIIDKSDLLADADSVSPSGIIDFSYEDQTDFTPMTLNTTPFDGEAFIATEDSIFLFTKDWQTLQTRIYSLSVEPGSQIAKFRKQWNVYGLITAAAWSSEKQELFLLGYTPLFPFIWLYSGFSPDGLTFVKENRTDFSDFYGTQTEGILILGDGSILVSSEESSAQKPATLFSAKYQ